MKNFKLLLVCIVFTIFILTSVKPAKAQFVIGEVIKLTVTKVIKAIDLKVQRMQNKTIWLQKRAKGY